MLKTRQITKTVVVPPYALGPRIAEFVADQIQQYEMKYCSKKEGVIIKVHDEIVLSTPTISNANSEVEVDVQFTADTLLPEIDDTFTGKVWKIFNEGVFLQVRETLQILIPAKSIPGYEISQGGKSAKCKSGSIAIGVLLDGYVTGVRYKTGKFNVIGAFKSLTVA